MEAPIGRFDNMCEDEHAAVEVDDDVFNDADVLEALNRFTDEDLASGKAQQALLEEERALVKKSVAAVASPSSAVKIKTEPQTTSLIAPTPAPPHPSARFSISNPAPPKPQSGSSFICKASSKPFAKNPAPAAKITGDVKGLRCTIKEEHPLGTPPTPKEDPMLQNVFEDEDDQLDAYQTEVVAASEEKHNMFITGMAGCGKSRVLKAIVKRLTKLNRCVFQVAHNGVAAANIGGMTIHSYAGLSGTARPPYSCSNLDARERIKMTDTLIIDEISTVDNHMLDGLDLLFRTVHKKMHEPFGGVQIIAVGDFAQLKPVDDKKKRKQEESAKHALHKQEASNPESGLSYDQHARRREYLQYKDVLTDPEADVMYCYKAKSWKLVCQKFYIFDKIYRQSDPRFLNLLNEIRNGELSESGRMLLESRRLCNVPPEMLENGHAPRDFTMLFSRRADVMRYNSRQLDSIDTDAGFCYQALDRALNEKLQFLISQFPVPEKLWLKVGARVMLKKNITRTMVNGLCGTVIGFSEIFVKERSSPLFRPIEGCILPRATANLTADPVRPNYQLPDDLESVEIPADASGNSFCPHRILATIPVPGSKRDGANLGSTDPELQEFEIVTDQRIRVLRANGFFPLPVVHFENGEVVTVMPIEWCVEDQRRRVSKKAIPGAEEYQKGVPERVKLASRVQIPLLHAWAISVHMSQGLTIAKLCVDLGASIFEDGQAYVAISRGQSLEGLLVRDLDVSRIRASDEVKSFYRVLRRLALNQKRKRAAEEGIPFEEPATEEPVKKEIKREEPVKEEVYDFLEM